jgi:hypothetical protein
MKDEDLEKLIENEQGILRRNLVFRHFHAMPNGDSYMPLTIQGSGPIIQVIGCIDKRYNQAMAYLDLPTGKSQEGVLFEVEYVTGMTCPYKVSDMRWNPTRKMDDDEAEYFEDAAMAWGYVMDRLTGGYK